MLVIFAGSLMVHLYNQYGAVCAVVVRYYVITFLLLMDNVLRVCSK